MNSINTLIKWPGGKAREIKHFESLIPPYSRYVEPFFGGGALFFYLKPQKALINDISQDLTSFYRLVKEQNSLFHNYLMDYYYLSNTVLGWCNGEYDSILDVYCQYKEQKISIIQLEKIISLLVDRLIIDIVSEPYAEIVLERKAFKRQLISNACDKILRTIANEQKKPFSQKDLKENLITGFMSGQYMYFRDVYNAILLGEETATNEEYNIANFYYIREYCYGSMFRYNSRGEFNIPYGGMSYNRKDFKAKIDNIFSKETKDLFSNVSISTLDFEDFLLKHPLNQDDFMFLDPPYDTDFSDYEGKDFTREDQKRLAATLKKTKANFILIIKNTDFFIIFIKMISLF